MEFKKGDEFEVNLMATKFDYDATGKIIGYKDSDEFNMDFTITDADENVLRSYVVITEWDLESAESADLEEEMKYLVEEFVKDNNIKKYSLKNVDSDYSENWVWATLVIE